MEKEKQLRDLLKCVGISIFLLILFVSKAICADESHTGIETRESWWLADDFAQHAPARIAVLPMDNLSLEPGVEAALYEEVYARLSAKGYIKIDVEAVRRVMEGLGIQTPGQLAGISSARLGELLRCDALLKGRVDQSTAIHMGVYDALVVSISLQLVDARTGKPLWSTEQWRAAHRQWHADPFNMLLSVLAHETGSRAERVAWLVQEMLKTLPEGPVQIADDNLLNDAMLVPATE